MTLGIGILAVLAWITLIGLADWARDAIRQRRSRAAHARQCQR